MWVVKLGLVNTWWAVILPYISGGQAFNMFLLKTFFEGLPEEMFEAARLDGAGHLDLWRSIIFAAIRPDSDDTCHHAHAGGLERLWSGR